MKCKNKANLGWRAAEGAGRTNKANSALGPNPVSIMQNKPNSRLRREGRGHRDVGRGANAQNEPNFERSFKCKVSSVKLGKPDGESSRSSYFKLRTLHFKLGRRPLLARRAGER